MYLYFHVKLYMYIYTSFIGLLMLDFSVQEWNHGKYNGETRCDHMLNEMTEVNLNEIHEPPCDMYFVNVIRMDDVCISCIVLDRVMCGCVT